MSIVMSPAWQLMPSRDIKADCTGIKLTCMLAISLCRRTLASWARASCCWYHCLTCWSESISAWEVFSRLCRVLRSSCTCWSWLWRPPICWRNSWTAKAQDQNIKLKNMRWRWVYTLSHFSLHHSPVLSLEVTAFCISSTFPISLLYWSSATFRSLLREARLAFLFSRLLWSSTIAFSSWLQLCRSVPTSVVRALCFSLLTWASSILACSCAFTVASWAWSSVFSLRA